MNSRIRTDTTGPGRARRVRRAARRGTVPDSAQLRARAAALLPEPPPRAERRTPSWAKPPQELPPVRIPRRPSLDGPGTGRRVVRRHGAGGGALLPRAAAIAVAREAARRGRADRHRGRRETPKAQRPMDTRSDRVARATLTAAAPAATDPQTRRQRGRAWLAVRERLPLWLQLRCGVEPKTLVALFVVLVVAVGFAAHHMWSGRPQTVSAPGAETDPEPDPEAEPIPQPSPSPGPRPSAPSQGGHVVVDIAGKVHKPGVHRLPRGARVADALEAAGGLKPGTDTSGLNRARVLADGEQIVVGETAGASAEGAAPDGSAPGDSGPVSLNSASAGQLETLPGIGPVLAQHIIDFRTQHGGFSSVDQLREVNGIGERRFADLEPLVGP